MPKQPFSSVDDPSAASTPRPITHSQEVESGQRFRFGKNWAHFLSTLTEEKITSAEKSLQTFLGLETLESKSFIDIGSGSGLFSLAARRLGARVHSFDYDPDSYSCTCELKRRYYPDDANWVIDNASVLDLSYLNGLGAFDIVYSWGVLHHTGQMWAALENCKRLSEIGGKLFIAIYNDQGAPTDRWEIIKSRYNKLPRVAKLPYALWHIGREEGNSLKHRLKHNDLKSYLSKWKNYGTDSLRGMNLWHDWIDWVGGYPYERATVEQIIDFFAADGFRVDKITDRSNGWGCNEFVFERVGGPGEYVDVQMPGGSSMARRHGWRLKPPVRENDGLMADFMGAPASSGKGELLLLKDDVAVGVGRFVGARLEVRPHDDADLEGVSDIYAVAATRRPFLPPFTRERGKMWSGRTWDLKDRADTMTDAVCSDVYLFEDGRQLPFAHVPHDYIAEVGDGRFSHWDDMVYFAPTGNTDPNINGRHYTLAYKDRPLASSRSLARLFGTTLSGPFERGPQGWTAAAPSGLADGDLIVMRDDSIAVPSATRVADRIVVAAADVAEEDLDKGVFRLIVGRVLPMRITDGPEGFMWTAAAPGLEALADTVADPNHSPVYAFQDWRQLEIPHALHHDIRTLGVGRFCHWGESLHFSTRKGEDPADVTMVMIVPALPPGLGSKT